MSLSSITGQSSVRFKRGRSMSISLIQTRNVRIGEIVRIKTMSLAISIKEIDGCRRHFLNEIENIF